MEALAYERLRAPSKFASSVFSPLIHRATELRPAFSSIHSTPLQIGRVKQEHYFDWGHGSTGSIRLRDCCPA